MWERNLSITRYPVEVSGWDARQNFFVERTILEWSESNGRSVLVRRQLQAGALVFVRLVGSLQAAYPLPYRVKEADPRNQRGFCRVLLEQMRGDPPASSEEVPCPAGREA